jgi:PAS domain-containing protein
MTPHLSFLQLTFLIGGAVVVALVLIGAFYALHKSIRGTLKPEEFKAPRVRAENETAFTLATMQAVISQLKDEQRATQARLTAAEQRAEQNARKAALLVQEMDQGLMIFDSQGFLIQSNALARELLGPDAWSRRRYAELFQSIPELIELVRTCLETGAETRKQTVECQPRDGSARATAVSVLPVRDRSGSTEAVICWLREVPSGQRPKEGQNPEH